MENTTTITTNICILRQQKNDIQRNDWNNDFKRR